MKLCGHNNALYRCEVCFSHALDLIEELVYQGGAERTDGTVDSLALGPVTEAMQMLVMYGRAYQVGDVVERRMRVRLRPHVGACAAA